MTTIKLTKNISTLNKTSALSETHFNWPIVGFLLFMTAIPGVPAIFILALVLLGPDAVAGGSIMNALYFEKSAAIIVHASAGILFFFSMPFQFSPALRNKKLHWHKMGGRIALLSGYVIAASGVWMHHVLSPDSFGMRYMSLVIISLAMCFSFSLALWYIINRDVQRHRKWMIRAVAITLAAITPLFVETILYLLFGHLEDIFTVLSQFQHDYGRLFAIGINLTVVEYIFFTEKRKVQVNNTSVMLAENTL